MDKFPDRREFLKAAAGTPVLGAFAYSAFRKGRDDQSKREIILDQAGGPAKSHPFMERKYKKLASYQSANDTINIGFIGVGSRGKDHLHDLGFFPPEELSAELKLELESRESLNVRCTAVCDLYQPNVDYAVRASGGTAKSYRTHQELLSESDVDAVVIATDDHWHAPIARAAAEAGKHVYVEKCMTQNIPEAYELRDAVKKAGIVFQLGHQNRNSVEYDSAMDVVARGMLGDITLIQCYTNRNSNNGAWFRDVPRSHGPQSASSGARNLDWEQYLSNREYRPYDPNRFFNWTCFKDYSTGLAGQLLSHEMDLINMIMQLGIPFSATASGGIYHYKQYQAVVDEHGEPLGTDEPVPAGARVRPDVPLLQREWPDVFQVTYEWPDRGLTVVYNATLGNSCSRDQIYLGSEATMEFDDGVNIYADPRSTRYAEWLESGRVQPDKPMITYRNVGGKGVEAITSATSSWSLSKGLLYTFKEGRRVSTTYLHHKNWIEHIRANDPDTLCHIGDGFQEAITMHMATASYLLGRRMHWDPEAELLTTSDGRPVEPFRAGWVA
ncbi:MAG: Gfo/Idh/MocA family oxidoreductase [Candidatus Glassbacteria bacterium]|nr:Gfo/Idh/MocA family oxidoreductase [Candidatus Glassbacteria bacterium]